ncbi:MAG TPA: NAD+ synthase [Planctomycetota bacterium]|nr:NAD+ synthase [Planctomycetota bacterium]
MKVALAQINPTIGDFDGNCQRIVNAARDATSQGAEITIFPEMSIMGYPARDLLDKPAFLAAQDRALESLCKALEGMPAIVGFVRRRTEGGEGKALYNSCALIANGKIAGFGDKCLLPTYDVFDEDRYFESAKEPAFVSFNGLRWGLTICEDCWNDKDFWSQRKYAVDPIEKLTSANAAVLVNISASPYSLGKHAVKERMLSSLARKHHRALLYVNQVGGNDDLVFDGRSLAFDKHGKLLARGPAFEEAVVVVDLTVSPPPFPPKEFNADSSGCYPSGFMLVEEEEVKRALVLGTRDYARKCGFKSAVLGLSGGIDSAVVAAIAAEAFGPENVTGVAMPSKYNSPESLTDAMDLAERLKIKLEVVPIENLAGAFKSSLAAAFAGKPEDVTEENMQARIRGILLMAFSNKFGHLLLTTGNKSELATGYCTMYGDMCGGLAVISDLYKTMVYRLANHINALRPGEPPIPQSSITKAPTAELRFNQKDQDTLPPYEMLDEILKASIEEHKSAEEIMALGFDGAIVKKVLRMIDLNEYKRRQAAPGLKITSKAFGTGRRMPIAQRFRE